MNSLYDICIYKYHEFIFREFYMKKQPTIGSTDGESGVITVAELDKGTNILFI